MREIAFAIGKKKVRSFVPESWEELSEGQFLAIVGRTFNLLEEGEFYVPDLIGMDVVTEDGKPVGKLTDVLSTGANDVYVVQGKEEHLIPAVKEYVRSVDMEKGAMTVHLIEGM